MDAAEALKIFAQEFGSTCVAKSDNGYITLGPFEPDVEEVPAFHGGKIRFGRTILASKNSRIVDLTVQLWRLMDQRPGSVLEGPYHGGQSQRRIDVLASMIAEPVAKAMIAAIQKSSLLTPQPLLPGTKRTIKPEERRSTM